MPFNPSRALLAAMLTALTAVAAAIALAGAAYGAGPTYNLQGGWTTGYEASAGGTREAQNGTYNITSMNMSTGGFSGTAVVSGIDFVVQGSETGSVATFTLAEGSYVAHDTLNLSIQSDGNVGGDGSFENGSDTTPTGYFWAELTTPTGTTTTKRASATQAECTYTLADETDVCTAIVGDATGQAAQPTGTVTFASTIPGTSFSGGGSCTLELQTGDVGVTSCTVSYQGSETQSLQVTATYSGDSTFAPSSGSTQFLTAGPGNDVYEPTIGSFAPPTVTATATNPSNGSTINATGDVTSDLTEQAVCEAPGSTSDTETTEALTARATGQPQAPVSVRTVLIERHVPKGKVQLKLHFNRTKLLRAFPRSRKLQLVVLVKITPVHGLSVTTFRREVIVLRPAAKDAGAVAAGLEHATPHTTLGKQNIWTGTDGCGTFTVTVPPTHLPSPGSSAMVQVEWDWTNVTGFCPNLLGTAGYERGFSPIGAGANGTYQSSFFGSPAVKFSASVSFDGSNGYLADVTGGGYSFDGTLSNKVGVISGEYTESLLTNVRACVATPPPLTQTSFAGM